MNARDLNGLLIALNATDPMGFKYPIGNKELTIKVRELESNGTIWFDAVNSKWIKKGKGINPRK